MDTSQSGRARLASTVYARAVRLFGQGDPRTVAARRELAAAHLAAAVERARGDGLDRIDIVAVVERGELPSEVTA